MNAVAPKRIADFTANERLVIRERHYGHEEASYALLARIFETTPQAIRSICAKGKSA